MASNFELIFKTHYPALCNYAFAIVKDKMIAEDIVQSLFVQLWENKKMNAVQNHERFLLRATKFKCIDYLRSAKTKKTVDLNDIDEPSYQKLSEIKEEDISPLLHYFASKLPPKTRMVFLKSREEQKTYKEIAEQMNISVKTVEGQMGRALRQMRSLLKEHQFFILAQIMLF